MSRLNPVRLCAVTLSLALLFSLALQPQIFSIFPRPAAATPLGTTIHVTTTEDELNNDGDCSLREAIQAANTDSTVDACPAGSGDDAIVLASATYTLTLVGPGENDNATGDLDIRSNLTLYGPVSATTVINGNNSDRVLHVQDSANVTLHDLTLTNGRALFDSEGGGGIYNQGVLTISNSILHNNLAFYSLGGGICNTGTLTLADSIIRSNESHQSAGGGIYNFRTLSITGALFDSNWTVFGGAIANIGTMQLTRSTLANNWAEYSGGAIDNYNYSTAQIIDCTFDGNSAPYGGGIQNMSTITITSSTFRNNSASWIGGAVSNEDIGPAVGKVYIIDSTFSGNFGGGYGGGAIFDGDTMYLISSTLDSNSAAYGGGICLFDGHLSITGSTLISNSAGAGGGIYNLQQWGSIVNIANSVLTGNVAGTGAGIWSEGTLNVTDSIFNGNVVNLEKSYGAGIYNASGGTASITGSAFISNSTYYGGLGAGVCNEVSGTMNVRNSVFRDNSAYGAGGAENRGVLFVAGCTFDSNSAQYGGGSGNNGTMQVSNSIFTSNQAAENGGAIDNHPGDTLTMTDSLLSNNSASNGGGAYNDGGTLYFMNGTLSGNSAVVSGGRGGGICNDGTTTIINSTLSGNQSAGQGGGFYNAYGRPAQITNATLWGNAAGTGGGLYNLQGTLRLANSIVVSSTNGGDCAGSPIASQGYNLAGDSNCHLAGTGDMNSTVPRLGPLQNNGGDTFTHALLAGSPAIDAIPSGNCTLITDQRGIQRPKDGDGDGAALCDVGAYEVNYTIYLPIVSKDG